MLRASRNAAVLAAVLMLAACQGDGNAGLFGGQGPSAGFFQSGEARSLAAAKDYFRQNNFGLAERSYREVLEGNPQSGEAWLGLAASYDRLGRFDLADKAYERLEAVTGRRVEVVNNLAYSQLLRGERKAARALFREAAAMAPGHPVVEANLKALDAG